MQRKCGVKCVKDVTYDFRQSFCFARGAESNKHVEKVKPSYTAPFDILTFKILTRETVFQEVVGVVG